MNERMNVKWLRNEMKREKKQQEKNVSKLSNWKQVKLVTSIFLFRSPTAYSIDLFYCLIFNYFRWGSDWVTITFGSIEIEKKESESWKIFKTVTDGKSM